MTREVGKVQVEEDVCTPEGARIEGVGELTIKRRRTRLRTECQSKRPRRRRRAGNSNDKGSDREEGGMQEEPVKVDTSLSMLLRSLAVGVDSGRGVGVWSHCE